MPDSLPPPFRKAVLGLNGGPTDELVVTLGCQLARPAGAELVAVHVIEVDWTRELSEDIASANEAAAAILDRAEAIAAKHKVALTSGLLQARDVGAAIVDEAVELGAEAILIGLPYRHRFGGDFALGSTVPYVFQNAPCQVLVVREAVAGAAERDDGQEPVPAQASARNW
ncbi:MAG TPA: universal stress protein [Candidatus Limnocylindria bacterium]|jgi:nucleotide-binding universal stress UspA family protein|nr:universal stress protein [Candidatus Limnocylindria bacterium]